MITLGVDEGTPDLSAEHVDCAVIGAGVVGLAVAAELARRGLEVVVVEAGDAVGQGISSRNSEVIHAGIYYPAASLKARLCVAGRERLYDYCARHGVAHRRIGKLLVATGADEIPVLEDYRSRAEANGAGRLEWLTAAEAASLEPAVRCVRALWSPNTGIIDSHALVVALQAELEAAGGVVALRSPVTRVLRQADGYGLVIGSDPVPSLAVRRLVNATGLEACRVAATVQGMPEALVPVARYARGHYYELSGPSPFGRLVYPVAGNAGLGVHVTLDLAGRARFGPDVQWIDDVDYGFNEATRPAFVAAIRRYYPDLDETRLKPSYTGIRPKICGPDEPAADFLLMGPERHGLPGLVHLLGIESPGLTASLALAVEVADRALGKQAVASLL